MKGFQPFTGLQQDGGRYAAPRPVLRELQPVLRTLNEKSNALVFEAAGSTDPQPKKATK